ncbi:MAG: AI-2E family transporter [Methanomicrobiales archaeon]|nr:AI-2E family transporter [Methanomicrobiales archaeon]
MIGEDQKLLLLIGTVFIIAIIAFWPLMTVFVWAIALAVALMPFHKRFSQRVKPSVSATLLTLGVLLAILAVSSLAASVLYANLEFIGTMVTTMVKGLQNTRFAAFLPTFTADQLSHMPQTLVQMLLQTLLATTQNPMLFLLQIIILFLMLSMLIYYGEQIWTALTLNLSPKLSAAVDKMSEITENTIYSLIIIQVSAALIAFILAVPFFYMLGLGHELLFATMIGFAMLIPLIGAQLVLLFFMLYLLALGDIKGVLIVMFIGYPLLSGWIDFYYRPVMMRRRVAVHPVFMIIGIFAGVPFMGFVGFILGPVLVALAVIGFKLYADQTNAAAISNESS